MQDIILGRSKEDREKLGKQGSVFIGKNYITMGNTVSLSGNVYLDISNSHVVFICGKRGSGKSYTMGAIAEGIIDIDPEISENISIIMLDTMGVYWTMKYPNLKDSDLLKQWGLKGKGLNVQIFTPFGHFKRYKEQGIPTDFPFSLQPIELDPDDWLMVFDLKATDQVGVLIERIIWDLKDKYDVEDKNDFYTKNKEQKIKGYSIKDIIEQIRQSDFEENIKKAAENYFSNVERWGLFDENGGIKINDLAKGGNVTVLDLSCYATMPGGWKIKSLVLGLVSKKMFIERMAVRKQEEFEELDKSINYFSTDDVSQKQKEPLIWLVIDEAHEFLPNRGKTLSSDPLITILREGRQPGISLILATQQPGKIHTDVMTQSDIVLSHRLTAEIDTKALELLSQSYMREGIVEKLNELPKKKGAAIVFDDTNERIFPIQVRPRVTWHGGSSPSAIKLKKRDLL